MKMPFFILYFSISGFNKNFLLCKMRLFEPFYSIEMGLNCHGLGLEKECGFYSSNYNFSNFLSA